MHWKIQIEVNRNHFFFEANVKDTWVTSIFLQFTIANYET